VKGSPDTSGLATFVYAAIPAEPGKGGNRGFAVDQSGLVCFTTDGTVPKMKDGALDPGCRPLK
jgi:hypothetical protein